MNNILTSTFYHNTLKDWSISIGIIILSFILGKLIFWFVQNILRVGIGKTKMKADDIIIGQINGPTIIAIVLTGFYLGLERLTLPDLFDQRIKLSYHFAVTLTITWFLVRVLNQVIEEYLMPLAAKTKTDLDDQLLPVIKKSVAVGTWVLGIIVALNNAGFNVGALLAGMGIGGLAFAMAAKDTIANFFGGITIFTDKPFKMGDRIIINGNDGYVQEIGLRSTRLKTLEKRIITIPNSKFIDGIVENITLEPSRKVKLTLGLTYDTTPEKMREATEILGAILKEDENTTSEYSATFSGYNACSLDILLIYYITKDADILLTQSDIHFKILEKFNAANLSFAFPTTTLDIAPGFKINS